MKLNCVDPSVDISGNLGCRDGLKLRMPSFGQQCRWQPGEDKCRLDQTALNTRVHERLRERIPRKEVFHCKEARPRSCAYGSIPNSDGSGSDDSASCNEDEGQPIVGSFAARGVGDNSEPASF